jgi:membrane associated rhomboid family serine protease
MNWALIGANVLVFILTQTHPQWEMRYWLNPRHLSLGAYFTYAFLHASIPHLVGNMLFLYIFGNNVNDKMGHAGYLAFYLAGGVIAGAGHVLTATQPVVGASGAVAAVTGAYLVLFPRSNVIILWFFWIIEAFEIPSLWFIAFFFMQDVAMAAAPQWFGGTAAVAHTAHISGTLFGVLLCLILLRLRLLPRDQFDVLALTQRWVRRRQFRRLVRQGFDPFGYVQPAGRPEEEPAAQDPRVTELRDQIAAAIDGDDLAAAAAMYVKLRKIDPKQILSRTALLDVANQLAHQQEHARAAEAYEQFLGAYPNYEQVEQVQLMLGLIYGRYLGRPDRAREHLNRALARLHREREVGMARAELSRLGAPASA